MDLLELKNNRAFPTVHALIISPFKDIWEADPAKDKSNAIKVFSFIELACSPKKSNPFYGIDETIRVLKVKKEVFGDPEYRTTDFMMRGMAKYKELLEEASPTYPLLDSAIVGANKLRNYLNNFNLEERTPNGAMVIKPKDITSALKEIPDVAKSIVMTREKVQAELLEDTKTRNNREIGQYED